MEMSQNSTHKTGITTNETSLHKYGRGPFCQFRIPKNLLYEGVYALKEGQAIIYIGMCQNLSDRFNARGYGTISPRNCFDGGQHTNCKINNSILKSIKKGRKIELWFYPTHDRHLVESRLILRLQPSWNSQLKW